MAKQIVNVGATPNDRDADSIRVAFSKINQNFTELYTSLGLDSGGLNLGAFEFTGSTITTTDSSAVTIDQATIVTSDLTVGGDILPSVAQGGDLGSASKPWRSLYVSNNTIFIGGTALAVNDSGQLTINGSTVSGGGGGSTAWNDVTGKPTFSAVSTSGSYADLSNKPTIPTDINDLTDNTNLLGSNPFDQDVNTTDSPQFARVGLTIGEINVTQGSDFDVYVSPDGVTSHNLRLDTNGDLTVPNYIKFKGNTFIGDEPGFGSPAFRIVAPLGYGATIETDSDIEGNSWTWTFGADGTLGAPGDVTAPSLQAGTVTIGSGGNITFPDATVQTTAYNGTADIARNIESENDVSIRVNLTDSTTHTWRFGEDGSLTLAGPITNLRTDEGKIALGFESGLTNQGGGTVAVGQYSGRLNQGGSGVAVGGLAGNTDQGASAVAVGALAGGTNQGVAAVAVGALAGGGDQGQGAVAIGQLAGGLRQGEFAIAIGTSAGNTDQPANSIVLNASGIQLNGSAAGLYVDPIRNIEGGTFLNYNTSTKEIGWSNDISSEGDISININLTDSTQRTWRFGEDGDLTFPNGQQIAADDPNILLIGSPDAGLILNSQTQSSRLIAKKTFDREFNDNPDYTFSATVGPPHTITVTFSIGSGLYLLELLSRLESKFNGATDFRFDYSNIRIVVNPYAEAISANILAVGETSGTTWDITIDQDPTAVVGNVTDIQILYDYNNTIGLDVGEDMFGIATDNDDIDIRSGRDIDLIAADDITFRAGSTFDLTLLQNDYQAPDDGLEIITQSSTLTNIWKFRFDGHLHIPGNIAGTNGISITPENAVTYAYFNLPSDANASSQGVAIGNDNGKIELRTTDQGTASSYVWKFDNDGSLTLPGEIHGAPVISGGAFPSQVGRTVNITPADDASDKKFKFRIDQYGETFTRAYLEFPTAEVNKQVAAVFPHTNGKAGFIYTQGNDTNGQGMNDAFNIFYNNGDIKITSMGSLGGLYTWKFGDSGDLTIPGDIQSEEDISIRINLADSTTRIWRFGEDGDLTVPGGYIKPDATDGFLTIEGPLYADMVQEEGGGVRTITNGVKIRTHRAFDDLDRDWNFSWDGAIYAPRDASNYQVGAIEWRTGNVTSQVRRTEGGTLLSGRVIPPGLMLFSNGTGAVSVLTGNGKYWTFEENGDLTIPGGIRSDGDINIDINLSDSTLRRWSFGEDGNLNLAGNLQFPNGAEIRDVNGDLRLRAAPGDVAQLQGLTTDGAVDAAVKAFHDIETGSYVTINTNIDAGAPEHVWTFDYNGKLTLAGDLELSNGAVISATTGLDNSITIGATGTNGTNTINGSSFFYNDAYFFDGIQERFEGLQDATGVVTHDCSTGHIFYHTSPDANWTVNLTEFTLITGFATTITIIIAQGGTGYYPNALQIGGQAQTINWQGNSTPTPSTNRTDVVSFSIFRTNSGYTVLGQLTGF